MTTGPGSFVQVAVFGEASNLRDYGRAVWAALSEVEAFYRRADLIGECRRVALDLRGSQVMRSLDFDWQPPGSSSDVWQSMRGRFSRTADHELLASAVQQRLSGEAFSGEPIIVTDQEITPPPNWRYILWNRGRAGWVISTAPMDPSFWGISNPSRVAIIKQRLRAALISVTGTSLGLNRCENESCYLFRHVDSVTVLDTMVMLGAEHRVRSLTGLGFDPSPPDPGSEQKVTQRPVVRR